MLVVDKFKVNKTRKVIKKRAKEMIETEIEKMTGRMKEVIIEGKEEDVVKEVDVMTEEEKEEGKIETKITMEDILDRNKSNQEKKIHGQ